MKVCKTKSEFDELIKEHTEPRIPVLWGDKHEEYIPYLCNEEIGDGKQLMYVQPLSYRPYNWLILVDSKTDFSSDDFDIEDILEVVEEECGTWSFMDEDYDDNKNYYPRINWNGGCFGILAKLEN